MAQDMFLKLTDIKGESKDKVHKDEIDILAWSWGASQSATMHMGGGGGGGKVAVQDLSCTKYNDKSTVILMQHCFQGKHIAEGKLTVRKAGGKPIEYLTISMKDILVSSVSAGGSGGEDRLTENVTLNFAKVSVKYIEQKFDGSEGDKPDYAYDMSENTDMGTFLMG
jgi:type VI secretion system secreted protein Hcp